MKQLGAVGFEGIIDRVADRGRWRDGAAFADAFDSKLRVGRERFHMAELGGGHLGRAWQEIVGEGRSQGLAGSIEIHFLVERRANTLRETAIDLAVDDHRIDEFAAVLDDRIVDDLDIAHFRIDGDHGNVRGVAERAGVTHRFVADGGFQPARIDRRWKILRTAIPGVRDLLQRHAAGRPDHRSVDQLHLGKIGLKQVRPNSHRQPCNFLRRRCNGPAGHHRRARAPASGGVRGIFGVAVNELDFGDIDSEDLMGDLRKRRLHALPMGMNADAQFKPAIRRHPRGRLFKPRHHRNAPTGIDRRSMCALLAVNRKTDADQTSVRLSPFLPLANAR